MNLIYFLLICSFIVIPDVQSKKFYQTSVSSPDLPTLTVNENITKRLKSDETTKYASSREIAAESELEESAVSEMQQDDNKMTTMKNEYEENPTTDLNKQKFERDENATIWLVPDGYASSRETTSEGELGEFTVSEMQQENNQLTTMTNECDETFITDLVESTTFDTENRGKFSLVIPPFIISNQS